MRAVSSACMVVVAMQTCTARAEDIASVRVGGGATVGPELSAWDIGYGTAWDAYIDGLGVRLGALLGMLSYPEAHATPALLTLTPDVGVFFGRETDLRVYYTLEVPLCLHRLASSVPDPDVLPPWLGARLGVELEKRIAGLDTRVRVGMFGGVLRNEVGDVRPAVSLRLVIEYGPPLLPPPPKPPDDRLCPDGTWKLPGLPCP